MNIDQKEEGREATVSEVTTASGMRSAKKYMEKKYITIAVGIAVLLIIIAIGYAYRGLLVAATVNGSPISRLSVIETLEKQGGAQVLDSMVTKKLAEEDLAKKGVKVSDDEVAQEIQKIEAQIKAQNGGTLQDALDAQGMTEKDLKDQVRIQKEIEALFASSTVVTQEEVAAYIKENKVTVPVGQEATTTAQITEQLKQQKLGTQVQKWLADLHTNATIHYFVKYGGTAPQQGGVPQQ